MMDRVALKLIWRKLGRSRVYSVINIAGLALALTAALLIYSHVVKEWKTDRFHVNGENIYRLTTKDHHSQSWESWSSGPVGPYTKAACPGVKNFVRVDGPLEYALKRTNDVGFSSHVHCIYTDAQFFDVFTFPFVTGKIEKDSQGWVVISQKLATHYFGKENPVGETIVLKDPKKDDDKGFEFQVVAVMHDFPAASTLQAELVADISEREKTVFNHWGMLGVNTYFELEKNADVKAIESEIPRIIENNYHWLKASERTVKLQPLRDIYFGSGHLLEGLPHGSKRLNLILCGITLLILVLASCNYMMIKIARMSRNTMEYAVQRCFGAGDRCMRRQIGKETVLHVLIALFFAVFLTLLLHPFFVEVISPKNLYPLQFSIQEIIVFAVLLLLFILVMTFGLSFYMFRRINRNSLKGIPVSCGRWDVKKVLSVTQMSIFCTLLCCSVVLVRQMSFVKNRQLGFDNHCVLNFNWFDWKANVETLRSEILKNPDIQSFSNGEQLPLSGENPQQLVVEGYPDQKVKAYMILGDADFLNTYQIKLSEGRGIRRESYPAEREEFFQDRPGVYPEIVVNRKFVTQLGLKAPLNTIVKEDGFHYRIVGVTEDFHFLPLYESVQPMFVVYDQPMVSASMLVRYQEGKRQEVIRFLEQFHKQTYTNSEFSYWEYDYSQLYDKDIAMAKLIYVFTGMAILISGMGIFAFSMFMSESRRKEIALRKVNGAEEWQIIGLLNRNFVGWVLVACAIGLPVADYATNKWLEGFAYKTELDCWVYGSVVVISVLIVLAITTWQIWKAATVNPIEALKNE